MQPNELGLTAANPKSLSLLSLFDRVWPPALLIVGAGALRGLDCLSRV
jgi:hypothetical protein